MSKKRLIMAFVGTPKKLMEEIRQTRKHEEESVDHYEETQKEIEYANQDLLNN